MVAIFSPSPEDAGSVAFYYGVDHFDDFVRPARAGTPADLPFLTLLYAGASALTAPLCDEIARHGWEIAGPDAYPELVASEDGKRARPASADEYTLAEAVARALPELLRDAAPLLAAWDGGVPVAHARVVHTHAGPIAIEIGAPAMLAAATTDILDALADLEGDREELDQGARRALEDVLLRHLLDAPEGADLESVEGCRVVLDAAADFLGATIATMTAEELREVLFETIPRRVTIEASAAEAIVRETRAFYTLLGRELGLKQAPACLGVLGGDAARELAAALSDPNKFGMAKQIVAMGRDAGFDMRTEEGVAAWMREMESLPLPPSIRLPGAPEPPAPRPAPPKDKKATKAQRKAARKARRKNR